MAVAIGKFGDKNVIADRERGSHRTGRDVERLIDKAADEQSNSDRQKNRRDQVGRNRSPEAEALDASEHQEKNRERPQRKDQDQYRRGPGRDFAWFHGGTDDQNDNAADNDRQHAPGEYCAHLARRSFSPQASSDPAQDDRVQIEPNDAGDRAEQHQANRKAPILKQIGYARKSDLLIDAGDHAEDRQQPDEVSRSGRNEAFDGEARAEPHADPRRSGAFVRRQRHDSPSPPHANSARPPAS